MSTPTPHRAPADRDVAEPGTDARIDQLVPPPWSRARRAGVAAGFLAAVAVVATLWWTGTLGPSIADVRGWGYGAVDDTVGTTSTGSPRGTVELQLQLVNRGQFPVEDLVVHGPTFEAGSLEMLDAPLRLGPRHREQVTFHLVIDDCSAFRAAPAAGLTYDGTSNRVTVDDRTLRVLGADASQVRPTWSDAREPDAASWWYEIAQPVCDPEAMSAP